MNPRDANTERKTLQKVVCLRVSALLWLILIAVLFVTASCSVPNLEKPQCIEARDAVKRFYSFHFGNDMHPTQENLKARESFLTSDLIGSLKNSRESELDYFTATREYPKAFRIGSCTVESDNKAMLQVLFFWRDDTKSEQKEVKVEAVKAGGKWLINEVVN